MKILVINGPNLNMLGKRDKDLYGALTLSQINALIEKKAKSHGFLVEFFTSNIEGEIVTAIQNFKGDSIIINAGGYTHTSVAIRDALELKSSCKKIEVHLSNILAREDFRKISLLSDVCSGTITGFAEKSYLLAIEYLALDLF